ncbi:ArsC family reductase [soil metagenome]
MKKVIVYGIPNCDTTKKALSWFKKNAVAVEFHDYKIAGIGKEKLTGWINKAGIDIVMNKRSTTWRELPVTVQQTITGTDAAIKLMIENTSLIKRPVIEYRAKLLIGYDEGALKKEFL